jgi:hypothetical protein
VQTLFVLDGDVLFDQALGYKRHAGAMHSLFAD